MTPRERAEALVGTWRREFGVICADRLIADIAAALVAQRREDLLASLPDVHRIGAGG